MAMFEHPLFQKIAAGVAISAIVGVGAMGVDTRDTVQQNAAKVEALDEIKTSLREIEKDVGKVKEDVAVIKDRSERLVKDTK